MSQLSGRPDDVADALHRPIPADSGDTRTEDGRPTVVDVADDAEDSQYVYFLKHLRVVGQCYVFETPTDGDGQSAVKYEWVDDSGTGVPPAGPRRAESREGNARVGVKVAPLKGNRRGFCPVGEGRSGRSMVDRDYRFFLSRVDVRDDLMVFQGFDRREVVYEGKEDDEDEVQEIKAEDVNGREIFEVVDEKRAMDVCSEKKKVKEVAGEECVEIEGCFDKKVGEVGQGVVDELACDNRRDSCVLQDFVPSRGVCYDFDEFLRGRGPSQFKSRLMSVLKKPFSQEEYNDLMSLINVRKPIVKYKHLRVESVSYPTSLPGYSYFDHYPDLAKMINSADLSSRLSLLRGFFFWLENVGHEGSFMPWVNAAN